MWAQRDAGMPSQSPLEVERGGRLCLPSTFLPSLWLFLSVIHLIAILYRLLASALFYLILSLPALYIQSIVGACACSVPSISPLLPPHPEGDKDSICIISASLAPRCMSTSGTSPLCVPLLAVIVVCHWHILLLLRVGPASSHPISLCFLLSFDPYPSHPHLDLFCLLAGFSYLLSHLHAHYFFLLQASVHLNHELQLV